MAFQSKRVPPEKISEFMRLARERYTFARQLDDEDRRLAEDDVLFAAALPVKGAGTTQWDPAAAQARIKFHRPVLTENRLPTFTAQVVNDGRQSKPAIKITALDGGTKETAEYVQGRMRAIEYESNADIAYDTAREQQVGSGRAFIRVTWEYEPKSFRKRPKLEPISNQFSVVYGPAREYDCSDADYCFVINLITREEHRRKYGTDTTAAKTDFTSNENPAIGWLGTGPNGEMIQEAEYWVKEYQTRKLCRLSDEREVYEDELPANLEEQGIAIEETRDDQVPVAVQYIIDGADILGETEEGAEYFGPHIPIVPQWGREFFIDGKRHTSSLIRYAKDAQRLLNIYVSGIAEQISQMPKTPWWIPVGGIPAGMEQAMKNLNNEPLAYALFNQYDPATGKPLDKPSRIVNDPPIAALVAGYHQAVDAIKAAMGIYDASLGNRSNETSGVAIESRKMEADNANFHFHDNEARTRKAIGRILLVLIAEFDKKGGSRTVRAEDGKVSTVIVGAPHKDEKSGKVVLILPTANNYGVAVQTGPSYTSRRDQAFKTYWEIAKVDPRFMQIAGHLIFRNSDLPGSDQIADIYEKTLPQELRPKQEGEQDPIPPELAQKWQELQNAAGQTIEGLTERVRQLEADIEAEVVQTASRERIAAMQEETKRLIAVANLNQQEGLTLLQHELAAIKHTLEMNRAEADRQRQAAAVEHGSRTEVPAAEQAAPPVEQEPQPAAAPQLTE